ncbi:MAG: endonuclease/exonuclease/phosphatase family protein [Bacteroidota bacterium]
MRRFGPTFCFLAFLAVFSGCASGGRSSSSGFILRVLTYNIHHGEDGDGNVDIDRIAKVILESKADLVALQEVDRGVERTKKIDTMTMLADLTGMTYTFGKNLDYQGGDYGNGVLVRYPILGEKNLFLRSNQSSEQRGLLQLVIEVKGQEIVFMNTHLDDKPDDAERMACVQEIKTAAQQYASRPVILCGDFNDIPASATIGKMKDTFDDSWDQIGAGEGNTYPASKPAKRLDYIFTKKNNLGSITSLSLKPVSARVIAGDASDHLPLLVEFEMKSGN